MISANEVSQRSKVIYSFGERLHAERPYSSPKVRKNIGDARHFLSTAEGSYDVILFALLDSHSHFSDYGNVRLDSFVFTREAFAEARKHLAPGGIMVLRFAVEAPWEWMAQRLYGMLTDEFGDAYRTYKEATRKLIPFIY